MSVSRRILQVGLVTVTVVIVVVSLAVIVSQTPWFRDWLRGVAEQQAARYLDGDLRIGRLDGNLLFGIRLEDVEITMDGRPVISIREVDLAYSVLTVIRGDVVLDMIRLDQPVVRAERTAEGWNVVRMLDLPVPDPDAPPRERPIEIHRIEVADATVHIVDDVGIDGVEMPERIDALDLVMGLRSGPDELVVDITHLSLNTHEPGLHLDRLAGVVRRTERTVWLEEIVVQTSESDLRVDGAIRHMETPPTPVLDLRVVSGALELAEIGALVPALRAYPLTPAFTVAATGPLDALELEVDLQESRMGTVSGDLMVDVVAPGRRVAGTVQVSEFDLEPLLRNPAFASDITGRARIDLALPLEGQPLSGTYALTAPAVAVAGYQVRTLTVEGRIDGDVVQFDGRANAYGASTTAAGTVVAAEPLRLDVHGRADGVDLRQLPADLDIPRVASRLDLDYRVSVRGRVVEGDARLYRSTLAGATIEPGTTAEFRFGDGAPMYAARGGMREVDLQGMGAAFGIDALADDRFRSVLHGTFDVTGRGGGAHPLVLDASASLVESRLFDASLPQFDVTARLEGGDLHAHAAGAFVALDPAVATGDDRFAGELTGTTDVAVSIDRYTEGVALDELAIDGQLTLEPSTLGGLSLESAFLDGTYSRGIGEVRDLRLAGRDLNATAEGTIALAGNGDSNLVVHLETPSLDEIGELVGQPLRGGAIVDATVRGNARELTVEGTLRGSAFAFGDIEALALTSEFQVTLPDLTLDEATIVADSRATFFEIAGQTITELEARVTYREPELEFAVEAQEGLRELTAQGAAVFHPDRQEIRLTDLGLRAEDVQWRIAAGTEALIDYGADRIAIDGLQLVSVGDQRIDIDGVFGDPADVLRVRVQDVDVAEFDRLVLGDERVSGRLTADAALSGTMDEPRVEAEFTLAPGAFGGFAFESLTGMVDYAARGVTLDVRLEQTPLHWVSVEGYAPLSLFRPTPPDADRPDPIPPGEQVDLTIASSEIDLGVIQALTDAVTDVTGILQANVRVTGTGFDPSFEGAVDIAGGSLAVPVLGTAYSGIDTRLELQDDVVTIHEMRILDQNQNALTLGGTLGVHDRALGEFDVRATAGRFQVLDNPMGDVEVGIDVQLDGELRAPRVRGVIEIEAGTIEVTEVVERFTTAPYRIDSVPVDPLAPSPLPAPDQAAVVPPVEADEEPGLFDAVDLNVGIAVPSNLLLRGTGIRPAGAPVAVGDINVTVGGVLQVRKAPGDALQLVGEVNTIRGHYTFQGRRFDIQRDGWIRFAGGEVIDPLLDIRARRIISGVETMIHVQGTMRQPELEFASVPPLDQADILSLIVFNMPLNELGEGQQISLAERAGALAGGYLAAGLTRSIGRVIGLDEFEIQARGELGTAPRVIIGERIGDDLFVRIEHGFGADQHTELSLEYQIAEFLRLTGAVAEVPGGTQRVQFRRVERAGIDLTFFFSF